MRIGKILPNGVYEVIYSSERPIQPIPFSATRSPAAWEEFLQDLRVCWGGNWANQGT